MDTINTNNNNDWTNSKQSWDEKIQLKKTMLDRVNPFDFKLVNLNNTGYIFVGTAILAPFFISILITYLFAKNPNAVLVMNIVNWIVVGVGCYFVLSRIQDKLLRTGAIAFYYFYFIPNIITLIAGVILGILKVQTDTTANLVVSWIADVICIMILAKTSPYIFIKIKLTFKQNYKLLIPTVIIALIITFGFNYIFGLAQAQITPGTSVNQANLVAGLNKWWNVVILAVYTIFTAPIIEELACRHGIFSLTGDKWVSYFASIIYFAGMHVFQTGDWEHFVGYLGASIALASLFIIARGNVTYTIMTHALLNTVTFILILTVPLIAGQ
ncbi:hypothetical protein P344_05280 [Spiroplasma mirum ATCC 29335]|uniref:CAAX prenyl protease 2/Lysostaphin resistance protein A-like domain-containing protein n=1 Tax=Spiroplasma mirum ATCC 29335 TaxID=838561 RepID=W0GM66_9MOLU|nr:MULTISPECIES: type II CAAX endopeptidase family protein [Spiroplasma]AHF61277.1 putative CAAX amino terminal protease [Spiroplasma mirum ATCC 29335]AHI58378.1 hypothetical protein P344_05280 [Spiroplasma mirum ATCC 29335]AKM53340.1 CAAX amino terminal membrane bound protease [Spiroplasma atrichopogonis]